MDTKKLNMFMNILKFGLVAVGVIACILVIGGPNAEAVLEEQESFREGASLGMAINYTMLIIIASIAIVLLFFVVQLITNTKKTVYSIIGILVALVATIRRCASKTRNNSYDYSRFIYCNRLFSNCSVSVGFKSPNGKNEKIIRTWQSEKFLK